MANGYRIAWKGAESEAGDYAVGIVGDPDCPDGWIVIPAKSRRDTKRYEVRRDGGGWKCSCPDFLYRRENSGLICKHVRILIECGIVTDARIAPGIVKSTRINGESKE
jgi:hypothetical protein